MCSDVTSIPEKDERLVRSTEFLRAKLAKNMIKHHMDVTKSEGTHPQNPIIADRPRPNFSLSTCSIDACDQIFTKLLKNCGPTRVNRIGDLHLQRLDDSVGRIFSLTLLGSESA